MKFALKDPAHTAVALIEGSGWFWPFYDVEHARQVAKDARKFGFWRRKR